MKTVILEHYDDDDIQKLNIKRDIINWNSELSSISRETDFYLQLLGAARDHREAYNQEDLSLLATRLEDIKKQNEHFQVRITDYRNQTENLNECQDMQCEKFFLNNHEECKNAIEEHLYHFRNIKSRIFDFFKGKMEIHLT